jgi:hypothetical protein
MIEQPNPPSTNINNDVGSGTEPLAKLPLPLPEVAPKRLDVSLVGFNSAK